jgi:glycosyltransferase involved in cell wall biosynthesis
MKVLMWGRSDLAGGGDYIQIENTAAELRKLGVEVDVSTSLKTRPDNYDLVHIFQLDWTPESNLYAQKAWIAGKPIVLSPIHHAVKDVKRFDDEYTFGFRKLSGLLFKDQHRRDTLKNIFRSIFDSHKRMPTLISIFRGLKSMHIETLKLANVVLVQTELEAKDLQETYGVKIDWVKIPNGVGPQFLSGKQCPNPVGVEDYILCVGRVEARKNQLSVIKAVKEMLLEEDFEAQLVFVGKKSDHHSTYVRLFEKEVAENKWITYLPFTPYDDMPGLYQHAKVCVSASWFETTGLTSLEALFMGSNVVASGDRAREFLGNMASYCDPGDIESIRKAVSEEYSKSRPEVPENLRSVYTWENAAKETLKVYKKLVK